MDLDAPPPFDPLPYATLDPLLWRPVAEGLWRQRETFDGTYDVQDLCDAVEFLDTRDENRRRMEEAARAHVEHNR